MNPIDREKLDEEYKKAREWRKLAVAVNSGIARIEMELETRSLCAGPGERSSDGKVQGSGGVASVAPIDRSHDIPER